MQAGNATARQVERLAASGIGEDLALRIAAQFDHGGEVINGVHLLNTEDWIDRIAADAFRTALVREVDRIIIAPGVERPL